MRKKVLSLILLWAALLALALIYTDRDEYTWRYEGGELAQIVIPREEADARQKQADEAMALTVEVSSAPSIVTVASTASAFARTVRVAGTTERFTTST